MYESRSREEGSEQTFNDFEHQETWLSELVEVYPLGGGLGKNNGPNRELNPGPRATSEGPKRESYD